ncbi:elongation factor P hydroxylase [Motiliproteus sp. SC1-56]|uniref:elongation factor P hydroxylase n=1 Tax=Motiliproteus sp. SC1-56 TaxID=2799565 RepID=UPI001F5D74B8|nr:elongation factor P hydroxylase [Motiliproteus sp. SC1-56]
MIDYAAAPSLEEREESHHWQDLRDIFDRLFYSSHNTRLVCGSEEPVYLPADAECAHHRVIFARGYFASALHEISHWCIAGPQRRKCEDYGYWYRPDGRSPQEQTQFEQVEARPQGLEWIFARACGFPFRVSVDNLNGSAGDSGPFKERVLAEARRLLEAGLAPRAQCLTVALADFYGQPFPRAKDFRRDQLDL